MNKEQQRNSQAPLQLDVITAFKIFNYGVDYGQLLMEQERESEEWADAFNCCLVSRKTAMPAMPIERRQAHSEDWKQAKKKSYILQNQRYKKYTSLLYMICCFLLKIISPQKTKEVK